MERIYEFLEIFNEQPGWKKVLALVIGGLTAFSIFFFTFFHVDYNSVEIMDSVYYTKDELRQKVLKGPFAYNSVLAPIFCSKPVNDDNPAVSGIVVTSLSRNSLCISVKEDRLVGCIPYLDVYVYFDINGAFTDSSRERNDKLPYFCGLEIGQVVLGEEIPFRDHTVLDVAIALSEIYQKNEMIADYVELDETNNIRLNYGDIVVLLGKDQYLKDKMARVLAILPKLEGESGTLHLESMTDVNKVVTFEKTLDEITAENWNGGYDEHGNYTEHGEYDVHGNYVGPMPVDYYLLARAAWPGGYDGDGDLTGAGPYDKNGEYVGYAPTRESIEADGDWHGGYDKEGRYITDGEYDYRGNYVGPRPYREEDEESGEDEYSDDEYDEDYYEEDYSSYSEDYDYYSEDYDEDYDYYY